MDLEKLKKSLTEMGFKPEDAEYKRLMAAAGAPAEGTVETPVAREVVADTTAADAVDGLAIARAAQAAAEAESSEVRGLLEQARQEIASVNERIGDLDGFRTAYEARYGVLTSDEDEASERAGNTASEAPLASDEEFSGAHTYEASVGLFRGIMSRWAERYGDAEIPEGAAPTAKSLAYIRRVQGTRLAGEVTSFR